MWSTNTVITRDKNKYYAFSQCTIAGLFFFYEFIQLNLPNSIYSHLITQYQLNASQFGLLSSIYLFADFLFIFIAGILIDTYPIKKIISTAMLVCLVAVMLFNWAHSLWLIFTARFIMGATDAFCLLSCLKIGSLLSSDSKKMAFLTGWIITIAMLGGFVAQAPVIHLINQYGYHRTMMFNLYLGIAIYLIILCLLHNHQLPKVTLAKPLPIRKKTRQIIQVIRNKNNWLCGLFTSFLNLPSIVLGMSWGIMYLEKVKGSTPVLAASATGMIFIGNIIGSSMLGWLADKLQQRKRIMLSCALMSCLLILLMMYSPIINGSILAILFLLLGFISSAQILSYPIIIANNDQQVISIANSCALLLVLGIAGMSAWLFGLLVEFHSALSPSLSHASYKPASLQFAMLLLPTCFIAALIISFFITDKT